MLLRNREVKRIQGLSNWMQQINNAFKIFNSNVLKNSFFHFYLAYTDLVPNLYCFKVTC